MTANVNFTAMAKEIFQLLEEAENSKGVNNGSDKLGKSIWNTFIGEGQSKEEQIGTEKSRIKNIIYMDNAVNSIISYLRRNGTDKVQNALKNLGINWTPQDCFNEEIMTVNSKYDTSLISDNRSYVLQDDNLSDSIQDRLVRYTDSMEIKTKSDTIEVFGLVSNKSKVKSVSNKPDSWGKTGIPPKQINPNDYTEESIRKKYPSSRYDVVKEYNDNIVVTDKATNKCIMRILADNQGRVLIEEYVNDKEFFRNYFANGELYFYDDEKGRHYNSGPEATADEIHEAVSKRKFGVVPTTGDLEKPISEINSENVQIVVSHYKDTYKESIFSAIIKEHGLDIDKRIEYIKHIKDALIESYKAKGVYCDDISAEFDKELRYQKHKVGFANAKFLDVLVDQLERRSDMSYLSHQIDNAANGQIDNEFKQGYTGDCWLVATIKAISNNPKAKKALESLISVDKFGNVTITLKGVNRTYTFTPEEIAGSTELSTGDMDVRAIEMAVNKYYHEEQAHGSIIEHNVNDIDKGGQGGQALNILFGKGGRNYIGESLYGELWRAMFKTGDSLIEKIKSGEYICIVSVGLNTHSPEDAEDEKGNGVSIHKNHAYSLVDADDNYVYLVNPWNTSQVLKMTHENFKKTFNSADLVNVSKLD